jgi:DNA polymerase-1
VLEPVDRAGVRERYGVEPEQVTALIALRGDPSDNIPGARGIGQKTAAGLLRRYGDLEGVIAHAGELTPRQRQAIEESAGDLRRYLDVASMRRDAPIHIPGDATLQRERAAQWCREAGMLALASRLGD